MTTWMHPPLLSVPRNWISPPAEMEEIFFPQVSWIIDSIHEQIMPLAGHKVETVQTNGDWVRRLRGRCITYLNNLSYIRFVSSAPVYLLFRGRFCFPGQNAVRLLMHGWKRKEGSGIELKAFRKPNSKY